MRAARYQLCERFANSRPREQDSFNTEYLLNDARIGLTIFRILEA